MVRQHRGAIERALEQAYRLGYEEAQTGQPARTEAPPDAPMVWDLIPRRPRKVLWSVCLATLGDGGRPETVGTLAKTTLETGGPGWRLAALEGAMRSTMSTLIATSSFSFATGCWHPRPVGLV